MTIDERIQALIAQRKEVQDEVDKLKFRSWQIQEQSKQELSNAVTVLNEIDGAINYLKQMKDETNRGSNEAVSS